MTDIRQVPAGWYDNGQGLRQWWDGYRWVDAYEPIGYAAQQQHLDAAIMRWAVDGWLVSNRAGNQVVLHRRTRVGWFWNTVGVLVTFGLWLIYVIYRVANPTFDTAVLQVTEYGEVVRVR
jgi:hypothetical protein